MRPSTRLAICTLILAALGSPGGAAAQPATTPAPTPAAPTPAPSGKETTPLAHVEARGTGPQAMILIPGLSCDWTVFETFMDRNADRYTMYAVTLPGFGKSEPPPLPESAPVVPQLWLQNAERAIMGLIEEKKLDKPVVMGHSLGGHLVMRLAVSNPGKFKALIAVDGAAAFPITPPGQEMPKADREKFVGEMVATQLNQIAPEMWSAQQRAQAASMVTDPAMALKVGEMCAQVPMKTSVRYMLELLASDVTADLKANTTPVLMVAAIADPKAMPADAETIRAWWRASSAAIGASSVALIENCRHFVMQDKPAELDAEVDRYLKSLTGEIPVKAGQ